MYSPSGSHAPCEPGTTGGYSCWQIPAWMRASSMPIKWAADSRKMTAVPAAPTMPSVRRRCQVSCHMACNNMLPSYIVPPDFRRQTPTGGTGIIVNCHDALRNRPVHSACTSIRLTAVQVCRGTLLGIVPGLVPLSIGVPLGTRHDCVQEINPVTYIE